MSLYEHQNWLMKLFRIKPRHDCRAHLPRANKIAEGVQRRCPVCGVLNVRYNYDDDDGFGGTGEFMTWGRA